MSGPISFELSSIMPQFCIRLLRLAERDPQRAVDQARRNHARALKKAPFEQVLAAYMLGYTLLRWERLDEAEQYLAEAGEHTHTLGLDLLALHVRRTWLYLAILRGGSAHGADEWAALATAYEREGDTLSAARSRLGQMIQLNMRGQATTALGLVPIVQATLNSGGTRNDRAWLLRLIGAAQANQGVLDGALDYLHKAATHFAALGYSAELAKTWIECARVHDLRDNPAPALIELERAYRLVSELDLPIRMAFCEKNMGWLSTLQGHYDQGIRFSLRAHDRFLALKRYEAVAECDLNLGNVAYYAGLWDLALAAYQRAEQVYTSLEIEPMRLTCCRNQALVRRGQGQPEAAFQQLTEMLPLVEQFSTPFEHAETIHARGQALADLGEIGNAVQEFERAEQLFARLQNLAAAGESRLERGWLLLGQGDLDHAEHDLQTAQTLLAERPIHQWRANYGLGRAAELRGSATNALRLYRSACRTVAHLRQRLANEHASSGLFGQAQQLFTDALHLAWREGDAVAVLELAELQRALVLARTVREFQAQAASEEVENTSDLRSSFWTEADPTSADHDLSEALQSYREKRLHNRRLQPIADDSLLADLDLPALRAACESAFPSGWTILGYVPCADQVLTVIVDAESIQVVAIPFDARLTRLLKRATSPAHRVLIYHVEGEVTQGGKKKEWQTLSDLGAALIPAGLLDQLHPEHRLLIVAGEAFQNLPWSALRVGDSWLVERVTPQLLPGLQIWSELAKRQSPGSEALLIGVDTFGERGPDLPNVSATLDCVERRWPGKVTRPEAPRVETVLEWAAKGQLRQYGHIHISTHGQLVTASGLLAHLKLADADLLYDDVTRLGLAGALVVLAACEGAASDILPGEEILSLNRAFLVAGARDVIASQWQMFDNVVLDFVDLLYDGLAADMDAPTALARAQRQWLERDQTDSENGIIIQAPLVWASMCALGAGTAPEV